MKKLIGITSYIYETLDNEGYESLSRQATEQVYIDSVWRAGGIPLSLPAVENTDQAQEVLEHLDALVVIGGDDIDPVYYSEEPNLKLGPLDPKRDVSDFSYLAAAEKLGLKTLGVCRGMQLINVYKGGSLYQHLGDFPEFYIQHSQKSTPGVVSHSVSVVEGSRLAEIIKKAHLRVNSYHHQAIKELGAGLEVNAESPDGLIEAVSSTDENWPVLAVQWHPEALSGEYDEHALIFDWLVD